jgi:nucleoside-diphosphate-sugar epimerase
MWEMSNRALIIGCGYVGLRVASLLSAEKISVAASTRSSARWPLLKQLRVESQLFDIAQGDELVLPLNTAESLETIDVFFMLPPSSFAAALQPHAGFDQLLDTLSRWRIRRATLVSSTSAYGKNGGSVVSAETVVSPDDPRGRRVVDIECRWLAAGPQFYVSRLAGLYGPDRIIGRRQLLDGEKIPGDAQRWLNLIHVDDAAQFIVSCNRGVNACKVELGSDGTPITRADYYATVAKYLGVSPLHLFDSGIVDMRNVSRRCDPSSTMMRLGWQPKYLDFRQGLRASMAAEASA